MKIYRTPTDNRERFTLTYYSGGIRKRRVRDNFEQAKAEAHQIAVRLANGQHAVLRISNADQESFALAMNSARPAGIPLHCIVEEYMKAREILGTASLLDAAKEYAKRNRALSASVPVTDAVEDLLEAKKIEVDKKLLSNRYQQTLRSHLRRFATTFQISIAAVTTDDIKGWILRMGGSPKTRSNLRASVITLFKHAQEKGHLMEGVSTAAERVTLKKTAKGQGEIGIFTPEQIAKLLNAADEEAMLYLAVGAFTGIRAAEMLRLSWEHFHWDMGIVKLPGTVTKTGHKRNVPILPSLAAWLADHRDKTGQVFSSEKAADRTIEFAKKQGEEWPSNALRHSFGSYRSADVKSHPQVAMEMGNSVALVKKHYDNCVTEEQSRVWFGTLPVPRGN